MFNILRYVSYNYEKSPSGNAYTEMPHLILKQSVSDYFDPPFKTEASEFQEVQSHTSYALYWSDPGGSSYGKPLWPADSGGLPPCPW